jgi:hypothetical protein
MALSRPGIGDWIGGIIAGATLGALVLGVGGRAAMRGVAIVQEWPLYFSFGGSAMVVMMGAIAGAGFAIVLLGLQSVPRLPHAVALLLFYVVVAAISLRILRPLDRDRLVAFPPLVVLHVLTYQAAQQWIRHQRQSPFQPR